MAIKTFTKWFRCRDRSSLGLLKSNILKQKTKGGGGNASAFQYYRYRIAPRPLEIDLMKFFELRYKKVVVAKKRNREDIAERVDENGWRLKKEGKISFINKYT